MLATQLLEHVRPDIERDASRANNLRKGRGAREAFRFNADRK